MVEVGHAPVLGLGHRALDLVAQAEVQRQPVGDPPVVLHEEPRGDGTFVVLRRARDRRRGRQAEEERGVVLQTEVVGAAGAALARVGVGEGVLAGLVVARGDAALAVHPDLGAALQRVRAPRLVQRGDERVRRDRPEVVAERHVDHGRPVEVEPREVPVGLRHERVVLRREAQPRQVEVPGLFLLPRVAIEPVVAVPEVQHGRRVEHVHVVDDELPRLELEPGAGRHRVAEVLVVDAVAVVPAVAGEQPVALRELLIDAAGQAVVIRRFRQLRVGDVAGQARVLRLAVVLEDLLRHGADPVRRNHVARERLADKRAPDRNAGQRIINRDVRRVGREVAVAQRLGRHPAVAAGVEPRADVLDVLEPEHEERPVLPAVHPGDAERAANREAGPVRGALDDGLAAGLPEEVVRPPLVRLREVVRRPAETVGARLDADARDAALRVAELGVERRRLHLEFLHEIRGRDVGRDHFVRVRRGGARRAVNQQVAAVAARALVGVADDVRRLVGAVQPLTSRVGQARRQAHDLVRVAVDERQRREARPIHDQAQVRVRRVDRRNLGDDADRLRERAHFQHDREIARLGHLENDAFLDVGLEAGQLDSDLVRARQEEIGLEQPLLVRGHGDRRVSGGIRDRHGRPGNRSLGRVGDAAGDSSACLLRVQGPGEDEGHHQEDHRPVHEPGWMTLPFHCYLPSPVGGWPSRLPAFGPRARRALGASDGLSMRPFRAAPVLISACLRTRSLN